MPRERVGHGKEHDVFASKNAGFLIKRQNKANVLISCLFKLNPELIVREWQAALKYQDSGVYIPESRIFIINERNYLIYQKYIEEDFSVRNIQTYLEERGLIGLAGRFERNPENFRSNNGVVYLLDFTHGFRFTGLLDRKGILSLDDFLRAKLFVKDLLRRFPLDKR